MTLAWFVIWLIANIAGGSEPLGLDPVNGWTATLILAAAFDLTGLGLSLGGGKRELPQRWDSSASRLIVRSNFLLITKPIGSNK